MKAYSTTTSSLVRMIWLTAFSIAMAFLEAAVVVYLREILYPNGFAFPLAPISEKLAITEFLREAATLVMLIAVGSMVGRTNLEKFVLFLYAFAIWDIFYYFFLKLIVNWPESLMTWDILFLIPVTWTGPVLAPIVSSLCMIILALSVVHFTNLNRSVFISRLEWILLIAGACFQFTAYTWDYSRFILRHYAFGELWSIWGKKALYSLSLQYMPESFNWEIFLVGEALILVQVFLLYRRYHNK